MDTSLAPIDVAEHWPFIDRQLFRFPKSARRALAALAWSQIHADGQPCSIRQALLASGVTAGEAGRSAMVLRQLEGQGILWRYPGAGRRPHHWSLRPDLSRWRGVHWSISGREVERVISGCWCRAITTDDARLPGHNIVDFRRPRTFDLSSRDHYWRPGRFLAEMRAVGSAPSPLAPQPGGKVVEMRDYGQTEDPTNAGPDCSSVISNSPSLYRGSERDAIILRNAIEEAAGVPVVGKYRTALDRTALELGDRVQLAADRLRVCGVRSLVELLGRAAEFARFPDLLAPRPIASPIQREIDRLEGYIRLAEELGDDPHQWDDDLAAARARLSEGA